jgi:hypothetical protein
MSRIVPLAVAVRVSLCLGGQVFGEPQPAQEPAGIRKVSCVRMNESMPGGVSQKE